MWKKVFFLVTLLLVGVASCITFSGVSDKTAEYFANAEKTGKFECFNKEKAIPFSHVNDDVCDCADGSDEPGTSACTVLRGTEVKLLNDTWMFRCVNKGYEVQEIHHYQVHDGICDCCDGSDEAGLIDCPNTCDDVQESLTKLRLEKEAMLREARERKEEYKRRAIEKLKELQETIVSMEETLVKQTAEVADLEAQLVTSEAKEAEEKAKLIAAFQKWHEENDDQKECLNTSEMRGCSDDTIRRTRQCFDRVERYTPVMCQCAGEKVYNFSCDHDVLDCFYVCSHKGEPGISVPNNGEYFTLSEASDLRMKTSGLKEAIEKTKGTLEYSKMVASKNGTLEFSLRLLNETYSIDTGKCTFQVNLFGEFNQLAGNARHKVGQFVTFGESLNSLWSKDGLDYTVLKYTGGSPCGRDRRSGEVKLVCGTESKILSGTEPSMCKYNIVFQTPFVCEDY